MENGDDKSTMYLYEIQGDVMLVSYFNKQNQEKILQFCQLCTQV